MSVLVKSRRNRVLRRSGAGSYAAMVSFEDFVNDSKECLRDCQAESRRRLGVDGKLELGWLLDRNIARFCTAENFVHHFGGLSEQIGKVRSIRHQTTCFDIVVITRHRGQASAEREGDDTGAV